MRNLECPHQRTDARQPKGNVLWKLMSSNKKRTQNNQEKGTAASAKPRHTEIGAVLQLKSLREREVVGRNVKACCLEIHGCVVF